MIIIVYHVYLKKRNTQLKFYDAMWHHLGHSALSHNHEPLHPEYSNPFQHLILCLFNWLLMLETDKPVMYISLGSLPSGVVRVNLQSHNADKLILSYQKLCNTIQSGEWLSLTTVLR